MGFKWGLEELGKLFQDEQGRKWEERYNKDRCRRGGRKDGVGAQQVRATEHCSKVEMEYNLGKWSERAESSKNQGWKIFNPLYEL